MSPVQLELGNLNVINFGRGSLGDQPVNGSNCSLDYDYYLGRQRHRLRHHHRDQAPGRRSGGFSQAAHRAGRNALALCSIDCPPNSTDMQIRNFGLTRITMDQIHDIIQDVEDLKYNDAQYQMNNELQNRDAQTKKGIYSDDFSNTAQSDIYHAEWDARVNEIAQFVAPDRIPQLHRALRSIRRAATPASSAAWRCCRATRRVLIEQNDWSEERNINPYAVFDKPPAMLQITPNLGRRGQTGIAVTGINFTPSKSGIVLRCDGQVMASNLISDEAGRVSASFTIPTNARNGNRIVEMNDGVYSARASLQINDPLVITRIERIIENRIIRVPVVQVVWRAQTIFVPRDPLAQTFSFTQNQVVSSVGLHFTAKDPSIPVTVQIRGVTTGLPNGDGLRREGAGPERDQPERRDPDSLRRSRSMPRPTPAMPWCC